MTADGPAGKARLARILWVLSGLLVAGLTLNVIGRFVRGRGLEGYGDFHVFHDAFRAVLDGRDLYDSGIGEYVYPPFYATVFSPLGLLPLQHAGAIQTGVSGLLAFACLWLGATELIRRFRVRGRPALAPAMFLITLAAYSDKFLSDLKLGQTDMYVLVLLLLSLRLLDRRPILAGVALGLAGNFKYQSLAFLPYLVVRRRWRALAGAVTSLIAFALSTALVHGWDRNIGYLRRAFGGLGRMIGEAPAIDAAKVHPITWIRSVSIPSTFARIEAWAGWPGWSVPVLTALAAAGCLAGVLLLYRRAGLALFVGRRGARDDASPRGRALVALEWTGLIVALLVFSPQTTARHMVLAFPLGLLASMLVLVPRPGARRWPLLASLIFLWLGFILPPASFSDEADAWRWIGGVSIALLTLLYVSLAEALPRAASLPPPRATAPQAGATPERAGSRATQSPSPDRAGAFRIVRFPRSARSAIVLLWSSTSARYRAT